MAETLSTGHVKSIQCPLGNIGHVNLVTNCERSRVIWS